MAEPMTTLSVEEFATKLAQLLGGQSSRVEENGSTFFHIDGLGERYVWVSFDDVDRLMHVGLQSIRGFARCTPDDRGVEVAVGYIKKLTNEGWMRKPEKDKVSPDEFKKRRAQIEKMIYETVQTIDPTGDNTKRWQNILQPMSDKEFAQFIQYLKDKKCQLNVVMPNMKKTPKVADLLKAAQMVGYKTSHRIWLPDRTRPGKKYLTNEKYLVLEIPIRRAQQEWDKKLQVPSRDTHIDALSGQVIMDDKACHLSMPEIQSLSTRGLENTLNELVRVRGGDVMAYGDFNRQLQESGEARLESLDPRTRARASVISHVLLQSMMIDNNL